MGKSFDRPMGGCPMLCPVPGITQKVRENYWPGLKKEVVSVWE